MVGRRAERVERRAERVGRRAERAVRRVGATGRIQCATPSNTNDTFRSASDTGDNGPDEKTERQESSLLRFKNPS